MKRQLSAHLHLGLCCPAVGCTSGQQHAAFRLLQNCWRTLLGERHRLGGPPGLDLHSALCRAADPRYVPKASCKYFCPTSFRYSSIALVANVFSLKMRCSFSPQRSTSDIIRSVKKSWKAKPMVGHQVPTRPVQLSQHNGSGAPPCPRAHRAAPAPHRDKSRNQSLHSDSACTTFTPPSVSAF